VERHAQAGGNSRLQPDRLAVATGPGSFTSLRVGLAFIKGVALALKIPVVGIPSLDPLAPRNRPRRCPWPPYCRPVGRVWLCAVPLQEDAWKFTGNMAVESAQDLCDQIHQPSIICGEMTAEERQILSRKWKIIHCAPLRRCPGGRPCWLSWAGNAWNSGRRMTDYPRAHLSANNEVIPS
jgi:tRNA threonylcarbamoyladenosine biosynthesis protein TsaB